MNDAMKSGLLAGLLMAGSALGADAPKTNLQLTMLTKVNPQGLAVSPNGSQVWVADTGPQTGLPSMGAISVISTATNKVTATLHLPVTDPRQVAFSPSGATAYVTTSAGVLVYKTATDRLVTLIGGLGNPEGVTVSPNGTVYVTNDQRNAVDVISAATNRVTRTIAVGQLPWQIDRKSVV